LKHFGCSPNNEAVIGDLDERYRVHSRGWYWRQAILGIVTSFLKEVWHQKLRTLTAVVVGWSALYLCYLALRSVAASTEAQLWPDSSFMYYVFTRIARGSWGLYYKAVHPAFFVAMRLAMVFLAGEISGRLVHYLGRINRKAMVSAFATSVLLVAAWVFVDVSFTDITVNERFAWPILVVTLVLLTSILHGGRLFESPAASA
jgi:hypothetical protein